MSNEEETQPPESLESQDSIESIQQDIAKESPEAQTILNTFSELIADPKQRRLFMRMLKLHNKENTKPVMWGKGSNPPYYRKKFAEELKVDIDRMMLNKDIPIKYLYADSKLSKKSLQLKINQSFMFLVEEMDTETDYYRNLRDHIVITCELNGIQLMYVDGAINAPAVPVVFGDKTSKELKKAIETFLEQGKEGTRFSKEGLQLNELEIEQIDNMIQGLHNVRGKVEHNKILILKLTEEQLKAL